MTTMNLKAVYEEVRRIMPTGHFCMKLEIWQFEDDDSRPPEVTFTIFDGENHLAGPTPQEALARLRAKHRPSPLDAVEAVEVPEGSNP